MTVYKRNARPYIPMQPIGKVDVELEADTVDSLKKFLDEFPVTKADEQISINRKQSKLFNLPFGIDGRAQPVLTVPPKVAGRKFYEVRQKLPIHRCRHDIIKAIQLNQVMIISGETGCGKRKTCAL